MQMQMHVPSVGLNSKACQGFRHAFLRSQISCDRQRSMQVVAQARRAPESGYFSEADPRAEVFIPMPGGRAKVDVTKRGGRYESDFIWNTPWKEQMDYEEKLAKEQLEGKAEKGPATPEGFLSFNRIADLNSMDIDLSEQLRPRKKEAPETASASSTNETGTRMTNFTVPPTKLELRQWERSGKFTKKVAPVPSFAPAEVAKREAQRLAEYERYKQLQFELQLWTIATAGVGLTATALFYTQDVAVSYGMGAAGSFLYLRMLTRSVDSVGSFNIGSLMSQQRLLVPVILVLAFNRWNALAVDQTGITLQLLPMLLGFFTYKGAIITRQSLSLFSYFTDDIKKRGVISASPTNEDTGVVDVASVDRAFTKRILMR